MTRDLSTVWKEDIITQPNFIENELIELNPSDKTDHFRLTCPVCKDEKNKAFLYKNSDVIICNHKDSCAANTPVIEYLHTRDGRGSSYPSKFEYVQEVKHWGEKYSIKFDEQSFKKAEENHKKLDRLQDSLKKFWKVIESIIDQKADQVIKDKHLTTLRHKYRAFTTVHEVVLKLKEAGFTLDDFQVLIDLKMLPKNYETYPKNYSWFWENRLMGCNVTRSGNIVGFWGKTLNGHEIKYAKNSSHEALITSFVPYNGGDVREDTIYLVEGFTDVDAFVVAGVTNIMALETSTGTKHHEDVIWNKKRVILFGDKDGPSEEGISKFLEKNKNADFNIFVVNPDLIEEGNDPNDILAKHGPEHLKNLLDHKNLISGHEYFARMLIKKHKVGEWNRVSQTDCFRELLSYSEGIEKPHQLASLQDTAFPILIDEGVLTPESQKIVAESLLKEKEDEKTKATKEKYSELMKNKSEEISKLHAEGKIYNAEEKEKELSDLREEFNSSSISKNKSQIKFISELDTDWLNTKPKDKEMLLTFNNKNGRQQGYLPKKIVAQIAGPGGVGKSHLMAQLAISIASGEMLFDKFSPSKPGAVFLGMGENTMEDLWRLSYKNAGHLSNEIKNLIRQNIAPYSFHGKNASFIENGEASKFFYQLKKDLTDSAPNGGWDLLIFDPVSRIMGAEAERDNAQATLFISLLEQLTEDVPGNPTVMFAHHVTKGSANNESQQNQSASRGSSALVDGVRWASTFFKTEGKETYDLKMVKTNFTAVVDPTPLIKDDDGVLKYVQLPQPPIEQESIRNY